MNALPAVSLQINWNVSLVPRNGEYQANVLRLHERLIQLAGMVAAKAVLATDAILLCPFDICDRENDAPMLKGSFQLCRRMIGGNHLNLCIGSCVIAQTSISPHIEIVGLYEFDPHLVTFGGGPAMGMEDAIERIVTDLWSGNA